MYFCAYRPGSEALTRAELFGAISRLRATTTADLDYLLAGPFAAVVAQSPLRRRIAKRGALVAAGDVRLDNREELLGLLRGPIAPASADLEIAVALIDEVGEAAIPRLAGDYSFVVWDARAQKVLAIRDSFGVRSLFMRSAKDIVMFSSMIAPLQSAERIDPEYVASFLVSMHGQDERTIWSDVRAIPAAHYARQQGTVCRIRRHWDPAEISECAISDADATEQFAALFTTAVTSRVAAGSTWAELSGGLDSSSVVATAAGALGPDALGGTITGVDSLANGDERRYSDQIVQRYGVRNEQFADYWPWQNDGGAPPHTDEPHPLYPYYARDRRAHAIVSSNNARVLLSGFGADHYLAPPLDYMTDLVARARIGASVREMAAWSIALRQSFWSLGRRHMVNPFLPSALRRTAQPYQAPAWVRREFAKGYRLEQRVPYSDDYLGRPGNRVRQQTLRNLTAVQAWTDRWPWGDDVEVRYPFLHRPLVEAVLAMPVDKRIRPGAQKWVLRQAMRDRLPTDIGTRQTKGSIDARILWSLQQEGAVLGEMLRTPMLAELGVVEASALREAVSAARQGLVRNNVYLMSALALETWLTVRAGRPLAARQAAQSAA